MKVVVIVVSLAFALSFVSPLKGQEVMVSFCSGIETIDARLAAELDRFKAYEGFKQAVLYKDSDSTYFMEIYYQVDEKMMRQRLVVSENDLNVLCEDLYNVQHLISGDGKIDTLDQEGRMELILSSMSLSLLYYSWAVPLAFDADNGRAYVSSYLLLGGASFFVPYLTTRNKTVTAGIGRGYASGGVLGIFHGWDLSYLIMGEDINPHTGLGSSVVTSIGESLLWYNYARKNNLSLGHMSLMNSGGGWGFAYGKVIPIIFESENVRLNALSSISGSALGIYAADKLGKSYAITEGDPSVINTIGLLGAYIPIVLLTSIDEDMALPVYITGSIIGSFAALAGGVKKTKSFDYDMEDGMLISLGTISGALTGAGFTYLLGGDDYRAYLWSIGIGSTAGFFLVDHLVRKKEVKTGLGYLKIDINPMALHSLKNNKQENQFNRLNGHQRQSYLFSAGLSF